MRLDEVVEVFAFAERNGEIDNILLDERLVDFFSVGTF